MDRDAMVITAMVVGAFWFLGFVLGADNVSD